MSPRTQYANEWISRARELERESILPSSLPPSGWAKDSAYGGDGAWQLSGVGADAASGDLVRASELELSSIEAVVANGLVGCWQHAMIRDRKGGGMGGTGLKVSERGMVEAELGSLHSGGSARPKKLTRAEEVLEAVYRDAQRHAGYSAGAGGEYSDTEYQNPSGKGMREYSAPPLRKNERERE